MGNDSRFLRFSKKINELENARTYELQRNIKDIRGAIITID